MENPFDEVIAVLEVAPPFGADTGERRSIE
jgi:hypothetical protein